MNSAAPAIPQSGEVIEVPALPRIPTGRNARRSLTDRALRNIDKPYPGETFWPVAGRGARREAERNRQRQARRGRALYVRRELAKERAASDLANLFRIVDFGEARSQTAVHRAQAAIDARVDYLAAERVKANPDEDFDDADIVRQLRTIAATATLPTPKVKTAR